MKRRDFLAKSAMGVAAAWLGSKRWAAAMPSVTGEFSAADIVALGQTGIKTSRLACGTGTMGGDHHSNQSALGIQGLADLLLQGYDQGLRFFDTADSYGTHPHVAAALKKLPREKITVMSKSWSRDAAGMHADIDRFRRELGTDYIDILMMHCLTDDDWTEKCRPAMDVISEAQEKGIVRAHGCSCHTLGALRAAAKSPWVQIMLSRVNPIGSHMDADPATVVATLRAGREAGKAIIGMKILGQGDMSSRADEALKYALSLGVLNAFTIGAENRTQQLDLIKRIAAARA
jgi:aryl-alcohol dehydrogenase-like predicted oxidoreductase